MNAEAAARATNDALDLAAYDFVLPPDRIAQQPLAERDTSRMLVLDRATGTVRHDGVKALARWLRAGDLMIVNTTRVVRAKLRGHKETGGAAEALVLGPEPGVPAHYHALVGARGRQRVGAAFRFARGEQSAAARIVALHDDGSVSLAFEPGVSPYDLGETPLPPYIHRASPDVRDEERYQAVFARDPGSIAAPTASLHLSEGLLSALLEIGVERSELVLHVGAGTFRPLGESALRSGRLHPEPFVLPEETARAIERTRARGGRVVAVGTTVARVLESCATESRCVRPERGETDLFLRPGATFRVVDALLTNFHLPRSSLLMLVAAFAGRERVLAAYHEAIAEGYRFFSYGDCMLVL